LKEHWLQKEGMWCIGNQNIPHVRQNTDAVVKSFHNNMKQILYSSQERLKGCRMDWLIYNLVGDVLTHYWYGVHCKIFNYVRKKNKKTLLQVPSCEFMTF
jgi:hypothetical protein